MFCCLCLVATDYCNDLYDNNGKPTCIYEISVLYFQYQISSMHPTNNGSHFLCDNCWKHIKEFREFQKSIIETQKQLQEKSLQPFENIVKSEVDIDFYEFDTFDGITNLKEPLSLDLEESFEDIQFENEFNIQSEQIKTISQNVECIDEASALNLINVKKNNQKFKRSKKCSPRLADRIHKKNQKYQTPIHPTKYNIIQELDEFIAEYWKDTFKCDRCENFECNTFTEINKHFRIEHDNIRGYVMCCQRKFTHRSFFVDHLKWHMNPNIFKCDECGKSFGTRRYYELHKKLGHKEQEKNFQCEVCKKKFAVKSILKSHMDRHVSGNKDYVCKHCNKGFVLKHLYDVHVRSVHNERSVCELCGKSIRDRYALKQHLLEHQGVEKRKWPCDLCGAQLNTNHSLKRHKRVAHHDGSTCYVCSECGKVSMTIDALRSHKKYAHQKERKYKCNICGKAFKVALVLKEHMATHTGEDLYECPYCPKKFKVSANMHHHRKRMHPVEWAANRKQRKPPIILNTELSNTSSHILKEVVL